MTPAGGPRILVVNTGSSTLKLRVLDGADGTVWDETIDPWDGDASPMAAAIERAGAVDAVGHRVVHGGDRSAPEPVTDDLIERLAALTELAPLHQPRAVAALRAARQSLPQVPHVACFDTAFHATLPPAARTYALPAAWRRQWGLPRYGFHGLSHAWVARHAPAIAGVDPDARIVSCHLGAGASACAISEGRSRDTTMGFTPLDGLVMATRSGSVDPGLLLWLLQSGRVSADEAADQLARHAGLAGLSGTDGDVRTVLAARERGDHAAAEAIEVYLHRLRATIAAMAAALAGIDVLAFTGGIGVHQPAIRAGAAAGLEFLGVGVDDGSNAATLGDGEVSATSTTAHTVVVEAREDLVIADEVRSLIG
ncbi:MAG TPA: acetate/propionate family kinase [Acidimicrobiales bacterium]|nr:acetate/propionate family kinase [Acidimicrobiales bacterium]